MLELNPRHKVSSKLATKQTAHYPTELPVRLVVVLFNSHCPPDVIITGLGTWRSASGSSERTRMLHVTFILFIGTVYNISLR